MTLGGAMFNGCTKLSEVKGAGGITIISSQCFQGCSALSTFDGSTITKISDSGFINCINLHDLECFHSLLTIESSAFANCTGLEFNIIDFLNKSKITVVGNDAFSGDAKLTGTWTGSIFNSEKHEISIGAGAFLDTGVTMTKVLNFENISKINDYQFAGATELNDKNGKPVTNIEIPENITEIGEAAFSGCVGIETVIIKGAITSLGANCFSGCQALTEVSFENKDCIFEKIPDYCFDTCKNLKDFTLPSSVKILKAIKIFVLIS